MPHAPSRAIRNSNLAIHESEGLSQMPEITESVVSRDEEDDKDDFNIDLSRDISGLHG